MSAKLIRDKVKDDPNLNEEARKHIRKIDDEDEHFALLIAKFFEEIGELMLEGSRNSSEDTLLDELVDVYTALLTIIKMNYESDEFNAAFRKKLEEKGGFDEGWAWDRHLYIGE